MAGKEITMSPGAEPKDSKKKLPAFKEYMEMYYGVEIQEPTPEELEHIGKLMEASAQKRKLQTGQEER